MKLEITYYAEGRLANGNRATLADVNSGSCFDKFTIDLRRWHACNSAREQEALLLSMVRLKYPEATWYHAHVIEMRNA